MVEGEEVGEGGGGGGFVLGCGGFVVDLRADDAFGVVGGDVEVVEEDEEGDYYVFWW